MYSVEWVGEGLPERKRQVFCAMAQGMGYKRIAKKLGVSEETIKKQAAAIYAALAIDDAADDKRTAAVCKGIMLGMIRLVDDRQ